MEAAERRIAEEQTRGIKNINTVRAQERLDQLRDQRQEEVGNRNIQSNLKVRGLILVMYRNILYNF